MRLGGGNGAGYAVGWHQMLFLLFPLSLVEAGPCDSVVPSMHRQRQPHKSLSPDVRWLFTVRSSKPPRTPLQSISMNLTLVYPVRPTLVGCVPVEVVPAPSRSSRSP